MTADAPVTRLRLGARPQFHLKSVTSSREKASALSVRKQQDFSRGRTWETFPPLISSIKCIVGSIGSPMTAEYGVDDVRAMTAAKRASYDAQVRDRIIRFREVPPNWLISPNCRIPGFERANYVYVGGGSYLDWTEQQPSRPGAEVPGDHFSCVILLCQPGKGAPLHAHTTEEMFLVLSGEWVVFWGDDAQHEAVLNQWDAVSFPGPVMRGFRNVGVTDAYLLSVIGGGSTPPPIAHPAVTEALARLGLGSTWPETHAAQDSASNENGK